MADHGPGGGPPLHVLVVDDDPSLRKLLATWLQEGFSDVTVSEAGSLAEMREGLALRRPDVVLLDQTLRDGNGLAAARLLLATDPDLDVVLVTGDADPALERTALEAGVADFLLKGELGARVLGRCIRWVIRRRGDRGALAHSEHHHRQVLRNLPGALVTVYDRDLNCVLIEGSLLAESGITDTGAFLGRHLTAIVPSDHAATLLGPMRRALEGESRAVDYDAHDTGRRLVVEVLPYRDAAGAIVGIVNVARDVTAERAGVDRLREAEERFRVAFERAPVGMALVGLDGHFSQVNQALCEMVAMPAEQLLGLTPFAIVHPDDADYVQQAFAGLGPDVASLELEHRFLDGQGRTVWALAQVTLICDDAGMPLHALAQVQDVTDRRRHEQHLDHEATHDPLTGLLNRRGFARVIDTQLARDDDSHAAVLLIDLDGFKAINDTLGHAAGDQVLVACADALRSRLRDSDPIARLGGDEFAVLLANARRGDAEAVAATIVDAIRHCARDLSSLPQPLTASVGVALLDHAELSLEDTLAAADAALYDAKRAGKNTHAVHGGARPAPEQAAPRIRVAVGAPPTHGSAPTPTPRVTSSRTAPR